MATSGNNTSGDGSIGNPWRTIQHAADNIAPGDTVRIMPGTYDEQVILPVSGSAINYITFRSHDPNNKATVRFNTAANFGIFYLGKTSYIRLKDLIIDPRGNDDAGVRIDGPNSIGNIVEDCLITLHGSTRWWSGGVMVNGSGYSGGPVNTLIQRNTITNTLNERGGNGPFGVLLYETDGGTVNPTISYKRPSTSVSSTANGIYDRSLEPTSLQKFSYLDCDIVPESDLPIPPRYWV